MRWLVALLGAALGFRFGLLSKDERFFKLQIGTRSVLYGAHCLLFHWAFVAAGWYQLFGFKKVYIGYAPGYPQQWQWRLGFRGGPVFASLWSPQLWLAFFAHDLGYIGKPNMDGPEGERHPFFAARLMSRLFDPGFPQRRRTFDSYLGEWRDGGERFGVWGSFCLFHSRFLSKQLQQNVSPFCYADKMAIVLTPAWLYLPMTRATGELREYMVRSEQKEGAKYKNMVNYSSEARQWYENMRAYVRRWVEEHKDGRADTWTPEQGAREPIDKSGVWK